MDSARDTIDVARVLIDRQGSAASAVVDRRYLDNLAAGDVEAAAFWSQVARAVRALQENDPAALRGGKAVIGNAAKEA
jgi:hypothetical protein